MKRVLFFDIDGTLLNDNKELPDGFFDIIDELNSAGIMFYTASGRNFFSQYKLFGDRADEINYICDNGAYISEGKHLLFHSPLDESHWHRAIEHVRVHCPEAHPVLCGLKGAYTEEYRDDILMKTELEKVYDKTIDKKSGDKPFPIYHITNNVSLTITLDKNGNFVTANLIDKKEYLFYVYLT